MSKDAPAPPDYSPLIAAQTAAAEHAAQVSADNLAWAKEQYQNNKALTDRVNAGLLDTQDRNAQIAKDANQRYLDVFQPQEDALVRDADTYASQEKKDQMVGMAQAGVGQAFEDKKNFVAQKVYFNSPSWLPALNPVPNASLVQTLADDQWGLVRCYADGRLVHTRELRVSGEQMRLPSGFKADFWQWEIEARVELKSFQAATTTDELRQV